MGWAGKTGVRALAAAALLSVGLRPAGAAEPAKASATCQISLIIEPFALLTWFEATSSVGQHPVYKFRVALPDCLSADRLDLTRITLDGVAIRPQCANVVAAGEWLQVVVHRDALVFWHEPVSEPLPAQLEIGIMGGHLLSASGYVYPTNWKAPDDPGCDDSNGNGNGTAGSNGNGHGKKK